MAAELSAHAPTTDRVIFAHRGLNRVAPENTMPAFELAAGAGVGWIETDVDVVKDGTAILIHDSTLDRTTNRTGSVYDLTKADLPAIDAGSWFSPEYKGTRIPTLRELVAFLNDREMNCNLELKSHETGRAGALRMVDAVIEELSELNPERELIVSSFSPSLLQRFHERAPQLTTAMLWETPKIPDDWKSVLEFTGASYAHLGNEGLTHERVRQFRDAGFGVNVYTVNAKDRINQLFNWGATGAFTDVAPEMLHLQG